MEDTANISLWLADLGITISNIEDEFSNGYLFGLILYRYNFQDNFGQFSNKPSYCISNISKIQLSLEKFSIKFDPHRIINKEPGYAKKLIEKIHKALHASNRLSPGLSKKNKSVTGERKVLIDDKIGIKMKEFDEIRMAQSHLAFDKEKAQRDLLFKTHLKHRSQQIEKLKQNKTFMQTWQQEGTQNWMKNQKRRNERILHENTVKMKLFNDKKYKAEKYNELHLVDADEGITEFEKNMIRLGIDHSGDSEKIIVKQNIAIEAAVTMAKIKENKKKNIEAAKEREIRQRNSYIQQKKNEKFEVYKHGSKLTGDFLTKLINQKLRIGFSYICKFFKKQKAIEETNKNIMQYTKISEDKWGAINRQHKEEIDLLESTAKKEYFNKKKIQSEKMIEKLVMSHKAHEELCRPIATDIILLADQVYEFICKNSKVSSTLWTNWMDIFKTKDKLVDISEATTSPGQEITTKKLKDIDYNERMKEEVSSYLSGNEHWGPVPKNYTLGDIVDDIIDCAFPLAPPQPIPEGPRFLSYKIIIKGPGFSGKKTQAKKLVDSFQLKVFEMPKIIEDAKKVIQKKSEPEDLKKKKAGDEESEIFVQASLDVSPDDENGRSKLFRARIRGVFGDAPRLEPEETKRGPKKDESKSQGYVLLNYPTNLQEAVDLERHLGGFVHPSELPPEIRDIKKEESAVLVVPSPKIFQPQNLFESAWDLVLWLDIDVNTAVRRATERRIDPAGNVYNLLVNPPPDNILAKCKTIDSPTEEQIRAEFARHEEHRDSLLHWFSLFGYKQNSILLIIDATASPDSISDLIRSKLQEINTLKNSTNSSDCTPSNKLSQETAEELYSDWEHLKDAYIANISKGLYECNKCWDDLESSLTLLLNKFKVCLAKPDEKQHIANEYNFEFNERIRKKNMFSRPELNEIHSQIDCISDTLWDTINQRRENFIAQREILINSYNVEEKVKGIGEIALFLCSAELSKYNSSINLIKKYTSQTEHTPFAPSNLHIEFEITSPIEDSLQLLSLKFNNAVEPRSLLSEENQLYRFRVSKIYAWAKESIEKFRYKCSAVFETLDIWISKAVRLENDAVNIYVENLHECLASRSPSQGQFPGNSEILLNLST